MSKKLINSSAIRDIEVCAEYPNIIIWPLEETAETKEYLMEHLDCKYAIGISDGDTFDNEFAFPERIIKIDLENYRLYVTNYEYEEYNEPIRAWRFIGLTSSLDEVEKIVLENSNWPNCTHMEEIKIRFAESLKDNTIFKDRLIEDGSCAYLFEYFARSAVDKVDYRTKEIVLGFKDATDLNDPIVKLLADKVYQQLDNDFVIAVVPPSKLEKQGRSNSHLLARLIYEKALRDGKNIQYEPDILYREQDVESAHSSSGARTEERAMAHVVLRHAELVRNRNVLVLDDVFTSGSSISGSRNLLKTNGALAVCGLVIGKTISSNIVDEYSDYYEWDNPIRPGFIFDLDQTLFDTHKIEPFRTKKQWVVAKKMAEQLTPNPKIAELIQCLKKNGYPVCIVTRSPREYANILAAKLGIQNVISYHDVTSHTDKKEGYLRACCLMGVYEGCCVVIGDDENNVDLKPAKELGMTAVHVKWFGNTNKSDDADFVVNTFDGIADCEDFIEIVSTRTNDIRDVIIER